ncbi:hypothetical protein DL95DRAFT_431848 [Leptodontidium sp. 2 PMI_412]|nr:hypothetical protein DL95DRAFT_431848 [Leptodontidium sp. 2 PMI_412]
MAALVPVSTEAQVAENLLAADKFGKPVTWITPMIIGGYNNLYRICIEDFSPDVLVRRPSVFFYSDFSDVGPFIIIKRVKHKSTLSHALTTPGVDRSITHALDPNISQATLEGFYLKVAKIILELLYHKFPQIGSLLEADEEFKAFKSSDEYYVNLAREHLVQLTFQHNDLVKSADDCRNKTKTLKLLPAPSNSGSFRLYGDDFRPGNMLINDADEIVSVIDWEFTYAAPTQFVLDPPWWLLLDTPEMWDAGIDDWVENYELRLETWLSAMKEAEENTDSELKTSELLLSAYMRESWETGRFWLTYAARKSWAFDTVFWNYLDERFFGRREGHVEKNELWKTREHLLTENARNGMEPFVERKIEEMKERKLVDWEPELARSRLKEMLLDSEM